MGKMEELMKAAGGNVDESMGAGDSPRIAPATSAAPARWQGVVKAKDVALIPLGRIVRDESQPREEFDEEALARLAESLKARGQLQPIRVRWDEGRGAYVVVVGERRWRAAGRAGLPSLTCVIVDRPMDPGELLAVQLVENALREDLKPVEQARAYRRLMEANGWSSRQLAAELSVSQAAVVKALALLELPAQVQEAVEQGALAPSIAYEVARLEGPAAQAAMARAATAEGLTRDEVVQAVRAVKANRPAPAGRPAPVTVELEVASVSVKWKKGSEGMTAAQVLKKALKVLQDRDRDDQAA
jgi:ParB family transcriptional regulator, chromosome partitioning protein